MASLNIPVTTNAGQDSGLQYVWATWLNVSGPNPGSGYTVGDVLTLVGGTGTAATFRVTSVDPTPGPTLGAVTGVALVFSGAYTVLPTAPLNTTGGTGTGCRLKAQYATITDLLADFLLATVKDFRTQWKNAQRATVAGAVESASNAQLANAAAALGVTLP